MEMTMKRVLTLMSLVLPLALLVPNAPVHPTVDGTDPTPYSVSRGSA